MLLGGRRPTEGVAGNALPDALWKAERSDAGGSGGTPPDKLDAEASEAASGSQPGLTGRVLFRRCWTLYAFRQVSTLCEPASSANYHSSIKS